MEIQDKMIPINTVIGWYEGITFVLTEGEIMFYSGMPEEYAIIGEAFTADGDDLKLLKPLYELKCKQDKEIINAALSFFDEYIVREDGDNV